MTISRKHLAAVIATLLVAGYASGAAADTMKHRGKSARAMQANALYLSSVTTPRRAPVVAQRSAAWCKECTMIVLGVGF